MAIWPSPWGHLYLLSLSVLYTQSFLLQVTPDLCPFLELPTLSSIHPYTLIDAQSYWANWGLNNWICLLSTSKLYYICTSLSEDARSAFWSKEPL
jgi:hypothetical protein